MIDLGNSNLVDAGRFWLLVQSDILEASQLTSMGAV